MEKVDRMQQEDFITRAMIAMGWHPDAQIPMANEENLSLIKELEMLTEERANLEDSQRQNAERVDKQQQHAKNAESSINHNLKLLLAYQEEVRTENHLFKVTERERSKLKENIKEMDKELAHLKKYEETTEKEVCKFRHRIDDMTNRIRWAKVAMQEWSEAMADGHKGYMVIEKYFKEDQQKAREQEQLRCKLSNEIESMRAELVQLYEERKALEQNLDCTAGLYRTAHAERLKMVETWKTAVNQMSQRERDISNGDNELEKLKERGRKIDSERRQHDYRLTQIINNNRDEERQIEDLNSETSDTKEKIQNLSDMVILKENEVEILQKELQGLSNKVLQQRAENVQNDKLKQIKTTSLNKFENILGKLERRYADMESKTMSAQQRLQILEDMNDNEQKAQGQLAKDITRTNGLVYRSQQQMEKFKCDKKIMDMENDGLNVTTIAIHNNAAKTELELKRKTELHYQTAFKCLEMERKIITMRGGNLDPEQEQINTEYLAELEDQYARAQKRLLSTEAQNTKLDDNMRTLTMCFNADSKNIELMEFKVKEAQVYCEGGTKRLREETHANQVLMVEASLLKMRIAEFEEEIAKCDDSKYNLQKHRMHLNRTIKDRMVEISSQMELLMLKKKHLCEEQSTLRADIGERNTRINAVKGRFNLTSKLLGTNEDGTLVTATQLKVELAQEKQILLDEGNDLNEKVIKAEEEIKAMENTLLLFNNSNDAYRHHYKQKDDPDQAAQEAKHLQSMYCKALANLKIVRNKILQIEQENEKYEATREELENEFAMLVERRIENGEVLSKLQREVLDQKTKLQRAERDMKQALKGLRQRAFSAEFIRLFDLELDLQDLQDRNTRALNSISDFAETDDEFGPKVIRILEKVGIQTLRLLQNTRSFMSIRSGASTTSSKEDILSTSRSGISSSSRSMLPETSARVSLVSIEFDGTNLQ